MEIVKIGLKTWRIAVVCKIRQSFFTVKVFTVQYNIHVYHCLFAILIILSLVLTLIYTVNTL